MNPSFSWNHFTDLIRASQYSKMRVTNNSPCKMTTAPDEGKLGDTLSNAKSSEAMESGKSWTVSKGTSMGYGTYVFVFSTVLFEESEMALRTI